MLFALFAGLTSAWSASAIEFKTTGPVAIFVDGRQATLTSNLRQRVNGLEPGVHSLEVSGMFGKKLYEAEIDLPDNTITYAAWERGEIKVLKTEWLKDEPPPVEAEAEDTGAEEPELLEAEVPVEPPLEEVAVAEPVPEVPPVPLGDEAPVALAPAVEELAIPVGEAIVLPPAQRRVYTLQAYEGLEIEIVHQGQKLSVVVEDGLMRIQDGQGLNLSLAPLPAPPAGQDVAPYPTRAPQ